LAMFIQTVEGSPRPAVMLLACPHFANSAGGDVLRENLGDMLAKERQCQIAECVERLKAFRPTKVAVEEPATEQSRIDVNYQEYRDGCFVLSASEDHQLGFRLAAELGHQRVFAIDAAEEAIYAGKLGRALAFAEQQQPELYASVIGAHRAALEMRQREVLATTVLELLHLHNDPAVIREGHQLYLRLALVMSDKEQFGVDWVQGWYARNLRIYANLARVIEAPDDRVLVIYGAGHVGILAQFLGDSGLYAMHPALPYLAPVDSTRCIGAAGSRG